MFAIKNNTERLMTTHLGDAIPPGQTVAVSEVTMENPTMQEWAAAGFLEVTEIQDPPPPEVPTVTGGAATSRVETKVAPPAATKTS